MLSYKQDTASGVSWIRLQARNTVSGVIGRLERKRLLTLWSPAIARYLELGVGSRGVGDEANDVESSEDDEQR